MKKFITLIVSAMLCVNAFGAGDISQVIAVDNNLSPRVRNEVPQASTKMRAAKPFPEKPMRRAAIAKAAAATAQTISFSEVILAADFGAERTFGSGDFTLTVTNELGTKASVDASTGKFGTSSADYLSFGYRLKTGGASKTTAGQALGMQLYVPADGVVTVYARSGSSSASRGLVAVQNGETLFAHIYSDTEAITDGSNTLYPKYSFAAQAGTVDLLFEDGAMYIYAFDYAPFYSYTIRVRKGDACTMDVSNGLWLWWWATTDTGGCVPTTLTDGWYEATIQSIDNPIACLAVNTEIVSDASWIGAEQTVDYDNITGDVCLEMGTPDSYDKYDLSATDCPPSLTPSFEFTQAMVYDYDASGSTNNYDIYLYTSDYDDSGNAIKGTLLYLYSYAKSMTSLVGTFTVNGESSIGDIYRAEFYYGDGNTESEITLNSGYVTISLDANGDYVLSCELTDANGTTYTEAGRTIAAANVIGYNINDGSNYTLTNEQVSAALSASEALTMTANLSHTNVTTMSYFVEGLVSNCRNTAAQVEQYGTNRFDISDDATTTNQLYGYNTKWLGNTSYTAEVSNFPQIGDRVVLFGPVQNYKGTTPEMQYGYIYECSLTASCALSNLQATSSDGYNYTFSWENTPYAAPAYTLLVYDSNGAQVYSERITTRNLSIEFTKSGDYTWAVRAEDSNGNVLNEATGSLFTVTLAGVDYTPYNLQASATPGLVNLSWSADYGEWFHIMLSWVADGEEVSRTFYASERSLSLNVSGMANVEVSWKVATVDENGNLLSDYVQGPAFIVPENPYQLYNLQASSTDGYNYTFSWDYLTSQADKYIVNIYDSNDNLYTQLTTTTTSAAYTFTEAGTYSWVVYAYDANNGGLGFANGSDFGVTIPTTTYSFTITTTVSDNCTMDFSNGMWYFWWDGTTTGSVQAWQNNEGKYVATIEALSESIGCLVATADPQTEGWENLQQTYDSPTLYGDACLLIGQYDGWRWYLDSRSCDEDLSLYLPYDLQVTTGVGTADFSWTATESEWFEVLMNKVEKPDSIVQYTMSYPALGVLLEKNAAGKWQWRVRALSYNNVALSAFVEGPEFEIKENPYLPYNLKATTQDSATYYLSWEADVQAPQYIVSVSNGFYEYVTTQPVEVTFTQEGWYYWKIYPCDENGNSMGVEYGENIYVPAHAVPDYSVTDLQVQTLGTITTATWKSTWDNFKIFLYETTNWECLATNTTSNTYFQWENLAAGNYEVDILPLDVNGSYVSDAAVWVNFTVEETTEPTTQYYISISAGPNGSVNSSEINGYHDAGTVLKLVATPNEGCRFVQWSDGNLQADRNLVLMQDTYLTASFELIPQVVEYTVTVNGAVGGTTNLYGTHTYEANTAITLLATPDEGYEFTAWKLDNGDTFADNPLFYTVTEDVTIIPVFTKKAPEPTYTLTVYTSGQGKVTITPEQETYQQNALVALTAVPDEGWQFKQWDNGSTSATCYLTMTDNIEVTATFEEIPEEPEPTYYTLTINPVGNGSVTASPQENRYAAGTTVTLTAVPDNGWQFKQWDNGSTSEIRYLTMTDNIEVTATFEEIPEEPDPTTYYTLTINMVGQGTVTASPQENRYAAGTTVTLTAVPNDGWQFKQWDNGQVAVTRTLVMNSDMVVTATFEEIPEEPEPTTYYTLTINPLGKGSVTASPQANQYVAGTTVTLTAVPDDGWQFKQWEDNTTNPIRSITMDADKTVMAVFEEPEYAVKSLNVSVTKQTAKATWTSEAAFFEVKVTNKKGVEQASDTISAKTYTFKGGQGQTYTIAVRPMEADKETYLATATTKQFTLERLYNVYISALSGGTVNDDEVNGDYEYGTEIKIVATPKAGYRFKKWSDDNTQATRKITIEEDVYLEASFTRIPTYTVTVFEVTGGTTNLVGDTTLTEGESLTIKATPEEGYIFSQWLVNGEVNTNNPFVITAIDQDYSIEPIFTKEEMGVEQTTIQNAAQKYMHNGVLYIRRGESVYDAQGKRVEQ